jgi:ubiquinone/menaquinone biosynthesis C-methylase UbiE
MISTKIFFDRFSREYEEQGRYDHLFYKWVIGKILSEINKEKPRILDLGTGTGYLATRIAIKFPKSKIIGMDVSCGMLNQAKRKVQKAGIKNIKFVVSPMEKIKINQADFVVSVSAFHHIKNKEFVISKIHQILPKNGKLVIGDWFKPTKDYKNEIAELRKEILSKRRNLIEVGKKH